MGNDIGGSRISVLGASLFYDIFGLSFLRKLFGF